MAGEPLITHVHLFCDTHKTKVQTILESNCEKIPNFLYKCQGWLIFKRHNLKQWLIQSSILYCFNSFPLYWWAEKLRIHHEILISEPDTVWACLSSKTLYQCSGWYKEKIDQVIDICSSEWQLPDQTLQGYNSSFLFFKHQYASQYEYSVQIKWYKISEAL